MFSSRCLRKVGQEYSSVAYVQLTHNVGIDNLTKYLLGNS
jgi:hypothetical protein